MKPNYTAAREALANLSLSQASQPLANADQAITDLRSLRKDVDATKNIMGHANSDVNDPHELELLFDRLKSILARREDIFVQHKRLLAGKGKAYPGISVIYAQELWKEMDSKLQHVLEKCTQDQMLGNQELQKLKDMYNPSLS